MLSETPSGVNLMLVNQVDLVLRAGYSELAKGGEETKSPVNCVGLRMVRRLRRRRLGWLRDLLKEATFQGRR